MIMYEKHVIKRFVKLVQYCTLQFKTGCGLGLDRGVNYSRTHFKKIKKKSKNHTKNQIKNQKIT